MQFYEYIYAFLCLGVTKDDIHTTHIDARNATIAEIERKKQYIEFVVIVVVVCMFFFVFRLVLCISTACSLFTTVLFLCCLKFEYISVPPGAYAYCCTAYTLIALHCVPKCQACLAVTFICSPFVHRAIDSKRNPKTEFHFEIMHKVPNVQHG